MKILKFALPLLAFVVLSWFLFAGLSNDPRLVPSPLIDKPAPQFSLPTLDQPEHKIGNQDFSGQVWMLNIWASWCAACKVEHPLLLDLAAQDVLLVGLNYKDTDAEAKAWLASYQNPYQAVIVDADGRVGIDFGVYGVPETFIIDQQGRIRYKHIGPVSAEDVKNLLSIYQSLQTAS